MKQSNKLLKRAGFEEDFEGVNKNTFVNSDQDTREYTTIEISKFEDDAEAQIDVQVIDLDTLLEKYGYTMTATMIGGLALKLKDRGWSQEDVVLTEVKDEES